MTPPPLLAELLVARGPAGAEGPPATVWRNAAAGFADVASDRLGTAVIIAIASSFGMPFTISTPQNAMVYGEGSLRSSDLLFVGGVLMLAGCTLVTLTGGAVLRLMGLP